MPEAIHSINAKTLSGEKVLQLRASSLVFPAEVQFQQKQVKGNVQSVSVSLVARTDSVVDTWMGAFVHDLKGMFHKETVPLDWRHEGDELIGFLDKFQVSNQEIRCSGQVVSVEPGDMASRIIALAGAGIPLEASIFFGGQGLEVEEVPAEKEVQVNGKPFSGPGLVFRKWPMRGVALCPYGKDQDTSVTFKMEIAEELLPALVLTYKGDNNMSKDKESADAAAETQKALDAKVKDQKEREAKLLAQEKEKKEKEKAAEAIKAAPLSPDGLPGPEFIGAFGSEGAVWFAKGMTFAEATVLYITKLRDRVNELEEKLASLKKDSGGSEVLNADDGEGTEEEQKKSTTEKKAEALTMKIGPNLARFAAGIKIRK